MEHATPAGRFGESVRQRRTASGLTLAELARRISCAKSYLSSIERGMRGPPGDELVRKLEHELGYRGSELAALARLERTPGPVRRDLGELRAREQAARALTDALKARGAGGPSLDELHRSGTLESMIRAFEEAIEPDQAAPNQTGPEAGRSSGVEPVALPMEVPLINKVTAGYPASFTDLGYPARIADEYIRAPDVHDPDAFAARVVGDSMEPEYKEGDIVVFSPVRDVRSGMDCFLRLEPDHENTFKRVYFEHRRDGSEMIRIQPVNNAYPPMTVPREQVAGMYAAVSVTRSIGS